MIIKIHRGNNQIGGCITEIATNGTRIIIDMGANLDCELEKSKVDIAGLTTGIKSCDAVFFTHYHSDHLGLYKTILPNIPLYIGEVAKDIFIKLSERIDQSAVPLIRTFKTFHAMQKIIIGEISITPLLIDHSAYDAYMFLVEADGEKVLHTGDFRLHGYRGSKTLNMLKKYVGNVDVLIIEGTMLSRDDDKIITERELQLEAHELMRDHKFVFVLCSSTNIDRIAAFYQATPKGRYFLCDNYQREVLDIITNSGGVWSDLYSFNKVVTYGNNLKERYEKQGFNMLIRATPYFRNIINEYKENCLIIYSMWKGYLNADMNNKIYDFLEPYNFICLHTSGHATKEAIEMIIQTVNPKKIIPIHTENASWFDKFRAN